MYFISYKCVIGEVGSYCQLAVTFFFFVSPYQTRDNVVPQFIFDPPLSKSLDLPLARVAAYSWTEQQPPQGLKKGLVVAKKLVVNHFWLVVNGDLANCKSHTK